MLAPAKEQSFRVKGPEYKQPQSSHATLGPHKSLLRRSRGARQSPMRSVLRPGPAVRPPRVSDRVMALAQHQGVDAFDQHRLAAGGVLQVDAVVIAAVQPRVGVIGMPSLCSSPAIWSRTYSGRLSPQWVPLTASCT